MPQPLPRGGMTPALRAQLAKKYNMRPEDYKPCAWSSDWTVQSYGDYPLLDFENAASRNNNYRQFDRSCHFKFVSDFFRFLQAVFMTGTSNTFEEITATHFTICTCSVWAVTPLKNDQTLVARTTTTAPSSGTTASCCLPSASVC